MLLKGFKRLKKTINVVHMKIFFSILKKFKETKRVLIYDYGLNLVLTYIFKIFKKSGEYNLLCMPMTFKKLSQRSAKSLQH